MFLVGRWNNDTSQIAYTPGLRLTPAQVDSQPGDTVEWMLSMGGTEYRYILCVLGLLRGRLPVVLRTVEL